MKVARSVAEVLDEHVTLELESIDRMYLNLYVPMLQTEQGVAWYFRHHRGYSFASSALMAPLSRGFVTRIEDFAAREGVDLVVFRKGQRKEDVAKEYLAKFRGEEGVLFIGKAQEKATTIRTVRRHNPRTRRELRVAHEEHGNGQPVLRVLRRPRLRPVLPEVFVVLPVQREALLQRS